MLGYDERDASPQRKRGARPDTPRMAFIAGDAHPDLAVRILGTAGIKRLVVLELHSAALESAFDQPLAHVLADEAIMPVVRDWNEPDLVLVSPDAGGLKRAQRYASALGSSLAAVAKTRPAPDVAVTHSILGDVPRT